jgi:hypothetical protein
MPRFVVLQHESSRGLHWDLLLEAGETLKTWALPAPPGSSAEMACDALPDHRLAYLQYEGSLSGDRGTVTRWDEGEYQTECQSDQQWIVQFAGRRLVGKTVLSLLSAETGKWSFHLSEFRNDDTQPPNESQRDASRSPRA